MQLTVSWLCGCLIIACNLSGCCIYHKPHQFGESSSDEDEDECGHCRGHKKKWDKDAPSSEHQDDIPTDDPGSRQEN